VDRSYIFLAQISGRGRADFELGEVRENPKKLIFLQFRPLKKYDFCGMNKLSIFFGGGLLQFL
jgi:hypothetical protein